MIVAHAFELVTQAFGVPLFHVGPVQQFKDVVRDGLAGGLGDATQVFHVGFMHGVGEFSPEVELPPIIGSVVLDFHGNGAFRMEFRPHGNDLLQLVAGTAGVGGEVGHQVIFHVVNPLVADSFQIIAQTVLRATGEPDNSVHVGSSGGQNAFLSCRFLRFDITAIPFCGYWDSQRRSLLMQVKTLVRVG